MERWAAAGSHSIGSARGRRTPPGREIDEQLTEVLDQAAETGRAVHEIGAGQVVWRSAATDVNPREGERLERRTSRRIRASIPRGTPALRLAQSFERIARRRLTPATEVVVTAVHT